MTTDQLTDILTAAAPWLFVLAVIILRSRGSSDDN